MDDALNRAFYRETVQESAFADGKVIRQHGETAIYAHVRIEVRSLSCGEGRTLVWNAGTSIPPGFASAVMRGIDSALNAGVLAELELTDICVTVENGSYHEIDSTADAFQEASSAAVKDAIRRAHPLILEAVSSVSVVVPEDLVAVAEATLASHGGQPRTSFFESKTRTIKASLPAAYISELIAELLRLTDGRANIAYHSDGFRPRPDPPDFGESWVLRE